MSERDAEPMDHELQERVEALLRDAMAAVRGLINTHPGVSLMITAYATKPAGDPNDTNVQCAGRSLLIEGEPPEVLQFVLRGHGRMAEDPGFMEAHRNACEEQAAKRCANTKPSSVQ